MDEMCFEFRSDRYTRVVSTTTKRLLFRFHSFFHVFSDPLIGFELVSTLAKGKLTTSFLKKKKKKKRSPLIFLPYRVRERTRNQRRASPSVVLLFKVSRNSKEKKRKKEEGRGRMERRAIVSYHSILLIKTTSLLEV